ncbi:MAG: hypothetical protein WC233_02515 [Sphaerochaeta sp.]
MIRQKHWTNWSPRELECVTVQAAGPVDDAVSLLPNLLPFPMEYYRRYQAGREQGMVPSLALAAHRSEHSHRRCVRAMNCQNSRAEQLALKNTQGRTLQDRKE